MNDEYRPATWGREAVWFILKEKSLLCNKDKDLFLPLSLSLSLLERDALTGTSSFSSSIYLPVSSSVKSGRLSINGLSHSQLHWIVFNTLQKRSFFTGTRLRLDLTLLYYKQYYVTYSKWPQAKTLSSLSNNSSPALIRPLIFHGKKLPQLHLEFNRSIIP